MIYTLYSLCFYVCLYHVICTILYGELLLIRKRVNVREHKFIKYLLDGHNQTQALKLCSPHLSTDVAHSNSGAKVRRGNVQAAMHEALLSEGVDLPTLARKCKTLLNAKKLHGINDIPIEDNPIQLGTLKLIGTWIGLDNHPIKLEGKIGRNDLSNLSDEELDALIDIGNAVEAEYTVEGNDTEPATDDAEPMEDKG